MRDWLYDACVGPMGKRDGSQGCGAAGRRLQYSHDPLSAFWRRSMISTLDAPDAPARVHVTVAPTSSGCIESWPSAIC